MNSERFRYNDGIPKVMGGFNEVFRNALREEQFIANINQNFLSIHSKGFESGKVEGFNDGVVTGAKQMMMSGKNQLFIPRDKDAIYPFGAMSEIYKDEKTAPYIKDFLTDDLVNEKLPRKEAKYHEQIKEIEDYRKRKIKAHNSQYIDKNNIPEHDFVKKSAEDILRDDNEYNKINSRVEKYSKLVGYNPQTSDVSLHDFVNGPDGEIIEKKGKAGKKTRNAVKEELSKKNKAGLQFHYRDLETFQRARKTQRGIERTKEDISDIKEGNAGDLERLFSKHKPGTKTAILKTDKFDTINIDQLRKVVNPNKKDGLEDIRNTTYRITDNLESKWIRDYRKNPNLEERTIDKIQFPNPIRSNPMDMNNVMTHWKYHNGR